MSTEFQWIVPVLSLVNSDYQPLPDLIQTHLSWLKSHGADGVLVMGTTGEFPSFSVQQRQQYLETIMAENPGLAVMVNIGAASLTDVLALQQHALSLQVNSILWMPPFYYPDNHINGLTETMAAIIRTHPPEIPFYAYHYPKMSQVNITTELMTQFPQVAGLKDTSGDFERIGCLVETFPEKAVFVGTDSQMTRCQQLGCVGIISGISNVFPHLTAAALNANTHAETQLQRLRDALPANAKMPALKAVLNRLGLSPQQAMSVVPFAPLPDEAENALMQAVESILSEENAYAG